MGWNELLILFIGWVLGLLSPLITSRIQARRKANELKKSILAEIDEYRIIMAGLISRVASNVNSLDHELIDYLLSIFESSNSVKDYDGMMQNLREMRKLSPEVLHAVQEQNHQSHRFLSLKKYDLPYLKANIGNLSGLDNEFQRRAFELLSLIMMFNEDIDLARDFHKLTFDASISVETKKEIAQELMDQYLTIANRAHIILKKIDTLLMT
jgi:hypothetical protein